MIRWVVLGLALLSIAADCQQCQPTPPARRGNLDRVADAVVVTPPAGHTFLVSTNPELQHLRVLDLTTEQFVDAPNRFFPASIPVGPETRRVAVAPNDPSRVYALDSASDQIFAVRTAAEDSFPAFSIAGEPIPTARAPADLAAFRDDNGTPADTTDDLVQLFVSVPDLGEVHVITLAPSGAPIDGPKVVALPPGSAPADVAVDPFGDSVLVGDAVLPVVHVIKRATLQLARDLDAGGPVGDIAVGVVDIGDGAAPVALALRTDASVAVALKLFRRGFREDSYSVLGSVELPAVPLSAYVPDQRVHDTVCCRALTVEAVAAGEASNAWAAVAGGDGKIVYLSLAAPLGAGSARRIVRLFDDDLGGVAVGAAVVWTPQSGDESRQPVPALAAADTFGDPPRSRFLDKDETLALVWQGPLPSLEDVVVTEGGGDLSAAGVDFAARGARVGDLGVVTIDEPPAACTPPYTGPITAVTGDAVTVDLAGLGSCTLAGGGAIHLEVAPADAFIVTDKDGDFLGRLGFAAPESAIALPGATLTLTPAGAGPPIARGSRLDVPLDRHLSPVILPLSDPPLPFGAAGAGGFGNAALLPVALTGGEMQIPGSTTGTTIHARRMQVATGSSDSNGLNTLFSCDEGETVPILCDQFR